jgi:tripartite-type tricarboxylate transporter receptor subunit TctC
MRGMRFGRSATQRPKLAPAWLRLVRCRQSPKLANPRQAEGLAGRGADRVCRLIDSLPTGRALAIAAALLAAGDAAAQPAEQFFARKTVTITIGYTAGGSYDLYGRMVARHLGKHIPGQPTLIAQNMPGAGSLKAANYLYEVAPKDGTALGVVVESAALEQALANPAVQYDAAKFTYVGRVATSNNIFMQWHTAKVQSLDDAKRMETSLAGTGPGSIAETVPRLLNALIGTRFKLISGYPASSEAMLAMERGEVEGASSSWAAVKVGKQAWLRERKIRIILQTTPERIAELPDAPSLGEIGDTPEDRQVFALYASGSAIGRSVIAPPGLPAERVAALRDAFQKMVRDPEFVADLQRTDVELDPLPGAQVEALVVRTLNVPAAVRDRAKLAFGR